MANLANVALFLSSEGLFCIIDFGVLTLWMQPSTE